MTEDKISVTIIAHASPNRGGIVQFCAALINAMAQKNNNVKLTVVGFKALYPRFLYPGSIGAIGEGLPLAVPIKRCLTWYNPFSWIKVAWQSRQQQIVHLQLVTAFLSLHYIWFIFWLRLFGRAKVVITCHNITDHERLPGGRFLNALLLKHADHLAVHAAENVHRLEQIFHIANTKVTLLPHGDFTFFAEWQHGREIARRQLGLATGEPVFLFFGYIRPYKGLRFLLEAWPAIKQRISNAKLIIAGEPWGESDMPQTAWQKYIDDRSVIYRPQYIPDEQVADLFQASDLIILPYDNDEQTISGPLLIAMSLNLPAVVSPCGGIGNMVVDGQSAFCFARGRADQLTQKAVSAWRDPAKRRCVAAAAAQAARQYSWAKVAENYINLFNQLIA